MKCFHQETVLICDLEDGVAYTSFLNELKSDRLKFSLATQKETSLAKALRKVAEFIRANTICTENTDASNKAKTQADKNVGPGNRRPRLDIRDSHFTANPTSILMEVKGHQC